MNTVSFEPTDTAWQARLDGLDPIRYAATRNHLSGAVSGLSPYFTHGFLSLEEAVRRIRNRAPLEPHDKLFAEFCWRAFFHHVWAHQADAIFDDLRPPLPQVHYAKELPMDIRKGCTGLAVIDQAVAQLYATGYLHNHARMWLASYVIHLRHVHWRAGADWMVSHLLDGDLASNHLSWQWVAGTFSTKPYLFNAENVAKYAPSSWHCPASPLDTSYEALERMARGHDEAGRAAFERLAQMQAPKGCAIAEPERLAAPPDGLLRDLKISPDGDLAAITQQADAIEVVHAWAMHREGFATQGHHRTRCRLGVIHLPAHAVWPWSAQRWAFVLNRLSSICDAVFVGDARALRRLPWDGKALFAQASVGNPETRAALSALNPQWYFAPHLLQEPAEFCGSFSKYFRQATQAKLKPRPLHH